MGHGGLASGMLVRSRTDIVVRCWQESLLVLCGRTGTMRVLLCAGGQTSLVAWCRKRAMVVVFLRFSVS